MWNLVKMIERKCEESDDRDEAVIIGRNNDTNRYVIDWGRGGFRGDNT